MENNTYILDLEKVGFHYGTQEVLHHVSFKLQQGELGALLGPSGCGKTTLFHLIAGILKPTSGHISLNNVVVSSPEKTIPPEKRHVGVVFQDYLLFPHLTVMDNIQFGLHSKKIWSKSEKKQRAKELLTLVQLEEYGSRYPHELSGGQQQRVALARALAPRPNLVLLDEPFSNLDASLRESMNLQMREWFRKEGVAALMVTHDREESYVFADKIGVLHKGSLEQWDTKQELYNHPKSAYVANFMGEGLLLQGVVLESGNILIEDTWEVEQHLFVKEGPNQKSESPIDSKKEGDVLNFWVRSENIFLDQVGPLHALPLYGVSFKQSTYRGGHWAWQLEFPGKKEHSLLTVVEPQKLESGTEVQVGIEWEYAVVFE
jgi:iron(III) transport system ATP-binding protein